MRFGVYCANFGALGDARTLIDHALESEEAGWDGFFLYDHIVIAPGRAVRTVDPWTVLAVVAERTELSFGPLITPVARRQPWELAKQTVALNRLSRGRLILGVGLGESPDFAAFGQDGSLQDRARRLDEGLEILRRLWAGESVSHRGQWLLTDAVLAPGPVGRIPIWVGGRYGSPPGPTRRAARFDGFFPINVAWDLKRLLAPSQFAEMVAALAEERGTLSDFELVTAGISDADTGDGAPIDAFVKAGATWWLEIIEPKRGPLEQLRARIAAGPPARLATDVTGIKITTIGQ
jgi:alkanesulfonate monooxygenase SsuD/methylene tetrahydromethanopterin reductase-like flavin-dependent oxidoreductase (luciferase family)